MYGIFQQLLNLPVPFNFVVLVVLICTLAGILRVVAIQARLFATHRADVQFKRELVERGLSSEEIQQIMAAKSPGVDEKPC